MARIRERPDSFFRLGPVEIGKAQCFAVRRGETKHSRCDVDFWHPEFRDLLAKIDRLPRTATIESIVRHPLSSGFAAGKGVREESSNTAIPQIRPTQILPNGELDLSEAYGIRKADITEGDYIKDGEVLFNNTNSTMWVGKSAVFRGAKPAVCSNHVTRLRLIEDIQPEFIADVLNFLRERRYFAHLCTNFNNQAGINSDTLAAVRLPLPDKMERARLLGAMNAARVARQEKLTNADALLEGLDGFLLETLGLALPPKDGRKIFAVRHNEIISEGRCDPGFHHPRYVEVLRSFAACPFEKRPLCTISPEIVGGATPTRGSAEFYASGGIKFFRILNVRANEFDLTDLNYIKEEVHSGELKRSQLEPDDVLMTITGRVGNAAVVTADLLPANINQHIVRLRITTGDVRPEYLAAYLNSSVGLTLSNRGVTGGTRVALDYGAIKSLQIPIPPPALQDRIVAEVHRRRTEARRLRTEAEADWQAAKKWFESQLLGPSSAGCVQEREVNAS